MADDPDVSTPTRRDFLKAAGAGATIALLGACDTAEAAPVPGLAHRRRPLVGGSSSDVVVIGGGIWGSFTALHLCRMGAKVTLVDAYGPGNARSTSGDESRGVRSSYGDRDTGEMWMLWAREAIARWKAFDAEWGKDLRLNLFHTTGDLILRPDWEPFLNRTRHWWERHAVPYEILDPEAVRRDFPVISMDDITAVLYEPDAGVVRARRSVQTVAAVAERLGARIAIGRARPGRVANGRLTDVALDTGETLRADTFVFAPGPWLGKTFPTLFANRMRTPLGYVCYFGTPAGDHRFTYPNLPSFNFPGVTGWASLPVDSRGFRVRGGERAPGPRPRTGGAGASNTPTPPRQLDPDTSDRWADAARIEPTRRFVAHRFPLLADAPLLQTHACHYELSSSRNFVVDRHPDMTNVWIAGGGNAEGFKFGPVIGEYVAQRALGTEGDPAVAKGFRIPEKEFELPPPATVATDTAKKALGTPGRR
ncbi:FAD dependent oxidoreductase [Gemmatirosa kalamazoonensis]|uniref:FAD dependent oxidoreductase n=1 Tax=Gemmatirosa kalamazoonensis TaxID=861299 RepID=W0RE78_9BACT|nr:FAD-dependent oxidoreductase [Gemmatirosa kalamazoonensis]AHG88635.1 FAD dependent oxidoreductase [Gemmatirosa kalamazoonensis]